MDIVDPTEYPNWDDLLLTTSGYSFFHSSAWARVLKNSYGYTPMYFASIKNGHFSALVPMMEVDSFLTGKRGVSLPFTDYCEPIINEGVSFHDVFKQIINFGKSRGWKYVELRGGDRYLRNQEPGTRNQEAGISNLNPVSSCSALCALRFGPFDLSLASMPHAPCFATYLGHTLDLTRGEEKILSSLRDSTRRNIKKAVAEGVEVNISSSLAGVKEFYRLNCITRKEHGLPPQPSHFFRKIYDHIIAKDLGSIALAYHKGRNIAGAVFFHFGDRGIYKYGASDKKFQDLRANNLLMWEGIKRSGRKGNKSFCFGRTELKNAGLRQYKTGWGGGGISSELFQIRLAKNGICDQPDQSECLQCQSISKNAYPSPEPCRFCSL